VSRTRSRTPLTLINGYASLLQDGQADGWARQTVRCAGAGAVRGNERAIAVLLDEASNPDQSAIRTKNPNLQSLQQPRDLAEADSQPMEPIEFRHRK